MSSEDEDYLMSAVDSALAIGNPESLRRAIQQQRQQLRAERNHAIWRMFHRSGMSAPQIAAQMQQAMKDRGVPVDQARRLTPSHDTIQRITGTRDKPKPEPKSD